MTNEFGGIKIVPRPSSNTVKISGPKSCVEEFKVKMESMVDDLKAQVEIQVEIARQHHRDIIGPQGHNVRKLTATHNVQISFPPQQDKKKNQDNGHVQNGTLNYPA